MNHFTPGPVLGIKPRTKIEELGNDKLQELWGQMIRNRDMLQVIKMIEGVITPKTRSEKRLRKIHVELSTRGLDPLRG